MYNPKKKDASKTYDEKWFEERFKRVFQRVIKPNSISYEATQLEHEEIDTTIIPVSHLEKLPKTMLIQTYSAKDEQDNEWLAGIVIDEKTRELLYEFWLENGKVIAYDFYKK